MQWQLLSLSLSRQHCWADMVGALLRPLLPLWARQQMQLACYSIFWWTASQQRHAPTAWCSACAVQIGRMSVITRTFIVLRPDGNLMKECQQKERLCIPRWAKALGLAGLTCCSKEYGWQYTVLWGQASLPLELWQDCSFLSQHSLLCPARCASLCCHHACCIDVRVARYAPKSFPCYSLCL